MKNQTIHKALREFAYAQYHDEQNRLSPQQWVNLLNGYYYNHPAKETAIKNDMEEVDVQVWYCRMALAVTAYALKLCPNIKWRRFYRLSSPKHHTISIPIFLSN